MRGMACFLGVLLFFLFFSGLPVALILLALGL